MTYSLNSFEAGRLSANARMYRPDPQLDRAADLYEQDRQAWDRLPARTRDVSLIHLHLRNLHRDAVAAGVIRDDRGPAA